MCKKVLIMLSILASSAAQAVPAVWYVDKDTPPGGDGTSWATAFQTIDPAVNAAGAKGGGEVWIAEGVYDEGRSGEQGALELPADVLLYGGFVGNETELEQRNWEVNECIIDASTARTGKRAWYAILSKGHNNRVDGIRITGALYGGLEDFRRATIMNCEFFNNGEAGSFNAHAINARRCVIENCLITNNAGRGFLVDSVTIRDCVLNDNGLACDLSARVSECSVNNTKFLNGPNGAVIIREKSDYLIRFNSCIFRGNSAFKGGAVHYSEYDDGSETVNSPTVFTNCVFSENEAVHDEEVWGSGRGGAVYVLTEEVFRGARRSLSRVPNGGEPISKYTFYRYAPPLFINCTFVGNRASSGGAMYWKNIQFGRTRASIEELAIANCVFWNNGDFPIGGLFVDVATTDPRTFTHCVIEGGFEGTSILDMNPFLRTPEDGDFRPMPGSPVIDAGIDTGVPELGDVVADFAGNPRGIDGDGQGPATADGSDYDIGAYEVVDLFSADWDGDGVISLSELLRLVQFFNANALHCAQADATSDDGYAPGPGDQSCPPHTSDYLPQNWHINLTELLRSIQFFNSGGYHHCPDGDTEDGFCPAVQ